VTITTLFQYVQIQLPRD